MINGDGGIGNDPQAAFRLNASPPNKAKADVIDCGHGFHA